MRSTSLRRRPILFKLWCRCNPARNRQQPHTGEHRSRPATAADAAATTCTAASANAATACATTADASVAATATDASATGTTADASVSATDAAAANDVSTTRAKPRNIEQDLALCINPPGSHRRRGCYSVCHGSFLGQEGCFKIGANRGRGTSGTEHTSPRPRAAKRRGESTH